MPPHLPSNVAGPSSLWGPINPTPPHGPCGSKQARKSLAGLLATRPDPSNIPTRFAVLLNRDIPQQDGRQSNRCWTVLEEDEAGSASATQEVTGGKRVRRGKRSGRLQRELEALQAAMQAETGTSTMETSEVEMPDVEMEESPLFALNVAASSGILHLVGREEAPENPELPDTVQDGDDDEMADALRCWTTEDDDETRMGPTKHKTLCRS
ncbi:hypothetical protein DFH08DRAFT_826213 [Mycena albidolilacea]|uniref:Uncharacterized protein n=1 Tax=Mycena albidolilacea TaxID=1033008 RepID=A0AAD7E8F2_9AGAR|nr:hypothetical protein DFH08DRAFT_826213 [Mycena albidolilacea]